MTIPFSVGAARVGLIDRRFQRRCGTNAVPVLMTVAAQSTTNREWVAGKIRRFAGDIHVLPAMERNHFGTCSTTAASALTGTTAQFDVNRLLASLGFSTTS